MPNTAAAAAPIRSRKSPVGRGIQLWTAILFAELLNWFTVREDINRDLLIMHW